MIQLAQLWFSYHPVNFRCGVQSSLMSGVSFLGILNVQLPSEFYFAYEFRRCVTNDKTNCISKKEACTVWYDSHSSKCLLLLFVLKTNKCSLLFVSILSEDMLLWLASPDLCAWDIYQTFHSTPPLDSCETYFFVLSLELDIITFHYVVQNVCSRRERRRKHDKKGSEWWAL